jgi:hypothetical protein
MAVAPAAIFLPAMPDEDESPLDHGHLFGLFELAGYRIQRLAALRAALAIRLVELVDLVDDACARPTSAARPCWRTSTGRVPAAAWTKPSSSPSPPVPGSPSTVICS